MIIAHGGGTRRSLSEREALRREAEGGLMREGASQEEADAAGVADDDGADLEQPTAQDPHLRPRQFGAGQADGTQSLQQHILAEAALIGTYRKRQ